MLIGILLFLDIIFLCAALYFMIESIHEKESRASYFGLAGSICHIIFIPLIIWVPALHVPIAILFFLYVSAFIIFSIPSKPDPKALKGSMGHVMGDVKRFDERDTLFARTETFSPEMEQFEEYCKRLIDEVGKGGGFIMDCSTEAADAKPENLKAMFDFTKTYGVYGSY